MGEVSKIEWTHATFNPVIGCARVSPGCEHCYAEAESNRRGWAEWGVHGTRHVTSDAYWRQPLKWNREAEKARERRRVFCASLSDVGEDHPAWVAPRARLFALVHETPWLDWLLLTKRPEDMARLWENASIGSKSIWPDNVWVGTTVEDQKRANERIPALVAIPAALRFLSCEPLLERVDLSASLGTRARPGHIDWVIVGGESGPGARPFALEWARDIVAQCKAANVAVFVKQLGAQPTLDGGLVQLRNRRKGGDLAEFPADLRLREEPPSVIPF